MTKKQIFALVLSMFAVTGLLFIISQYMFAGEDCLCDYAYIYDKYEYICPTGFDLDVIEPYGGYCQGTTCVKQYRTICIGEQLSFDMHNARVIYTYEYIPGCCSMDQFEQ